MKSLFSNKQEKEKAILVNPMPQNKDEETVLESMSELEQLSKTAGAICLEKMNIKLRNIDAATFISKGKLEELFNIKNRLSANLIIFNCELKPGQVRNLEEKLQCKVISRTELIMDIFAQHASTNEAKIQVELAQLRFLLPRLTGSGEALAQLRSGIGMRGPGETKLEYDKRHIRQRISVLQDKLEKILRHRELLWGARKDNVAVLVGYTNAGKSTLLNTLAHENLKAMDALFVTLDSTTRKVWLGNGKQILVSDTVGFINDLPPHLVASFRATLGEIQKADIVIHVVDISGNLIENKIKVVVDVLCQLDANAKKGFIVFNKIDRINNPEKIKRLENLYQGSVFISARTGEGTDRLKEKILELIQ